jgi:lactate dehydrogenase-like 2-hydroxyacid dehydrogenase
MSSMPSNRISSQVFSDTDVVSSKSPVITDRNDFQNFKVLIIGLGRLGLPVAKYVKEKDLIHMDMILSGWL